VTLAHSPVNISLERRLLHPLSPRGKLVHWGLEGLAATNRMVDAALQASDAPSDAILLRPELYRVATSNDHVEQLRQTAALYPQIAEWRDPEHATNPTPFGALRLFNGCCVLHVPSYLLGLYAACRHEAARKGSSIRWQQIGSPHNKAVQGARTLDDQSWDVTVYCYGANMFERRSTKDSPSWFSPSGFDSSSTTRGRSVLPIQLVRGQSIEVQLQQPLPLALLCGKYISPVPHHPDRALIGATHEFQLEPLSEQRVVQELRDRTKDFAPFCWEDADEIKGDDSDLSPSSSRLVCLTQGYRVQSARGKYGRRPIIGQLPSSMDATTDDAPSRSSWIFTGLSSRGLLYHGLYGQLLSQAILQRDESLLLRHCPDIQWWKNDDSEIG
jgi:FAD dependent oxidoreductase